MREVCSNIRLCRMTRINTFANERSKFGNHSKLNISSNEKNYVSSIDGAQFRKRALYLWMKISNHKKVHPKQKTKTNLREPMEAGRGVHKVQTLIRKEPTIERARHARDKAPVETIPILSLQLVVELRQWLKHFVEVIARKIIQRHPEFWYRAAQAKASGMHNIYYFRDHR